MSVHLLKLCVGIERQTHLEELCTARADQAEAQFGKRFTWHVTRRMPKRADELKQGGSLYWVMGGYIRCRQTILDIEQVTDSYGKPACLIRLSPTVISVTPIQKKPFQGWRYLEPAAAPADILGDSGDDVEDMPDWMVAELGELGLL